MGNEQNKESLSGGRLLIIESGKSLPPITLRVAMPAVKPPRLPSTPPDWRSADVEHLVASAAEPKSPSKPPDENSGQQ